jgi:hypothetical protein
MSDVRTAHMASGAGAGRHDARQDRMVFRPRYYFS